MNITFERVFMCPTVTQRQNFQRSVTFWVAILPRMMEMDMIPPARPGSMRPSLHILILSLPLPTQTTVEAMGEGRLLAPTYLHPSLPGQIQQTLFNLPFLP